MTDAEIREVADRTADAFAWDSYRPGAWLACCRLLAKRGYTAREIEAILRSKWMRWAGDMDTGHGGRAYGRYTADTLRRFLEAELRQRGAVGLAGQVAELVAGTFGGDDASGAGVHYTQTANGRPACEGYKRETIPDDEPGSPDRRLTTCADCLDVREDPTEE